MIRRRVVAGALALFVATWLLITVILVTGHDPALARQTKSASAQTTTTSSGSGNTSSSSTGGSSGTSSSSGGGSGLSAVTSSQS
jgi:uncharacterized membrane protein YgcG